VTIAAGMGKSMKVHSEAPRKRGFGRGATRIGLLDVLTALILLALLLWASWEQFPAYRAAAIPAATPGAAAPDQY